MPLPEISPSKVSQFTLPDYALRVTEDQIGLETRRSVLEDGRNSTISVYYDHLTANQVLEFITFYQEVVPQNRGFGLSNAILEYPDDLFQTYLDILGEVVYYFNTKPDIVTNIDNSYNVTINLKADKKGIELLFDIHENTPLFFQR